MHPNYPQPTVPATGGEGWGAIRAPFQTNFCTYLLTQHSTYSLTNLLIMRAHTVQGPLFAEASSGAASGLLLEEARGPLLPVLTNGREGLHKNVQA